jgi:hypothetical protein
MPEAGRIDEIEPILQVARRHANLYVLGGVAEDHAPSAELVVDRQLPDTPRIHERYLRKVDQRRPSRGQTVAQDVLEGLPVSNVELPGELDQYGSIPAPVASGCFGYCWVALYGATPVGLVT